LNCPYCSNARSTVTGTILVKDNTRNRRRKCCACGLTFYTVQSSLPEYSLVCTNSKYSLRPERRWVSFGELGCEPPAIELKCSRRSLGCPRCGSAGKVTNARALSDGVIVEGRPSPVKVRRHRCIDPACGQAYSSAEVPLPKGAVKHRADSSLFDRRPEFAAVQFCSDASAVAAVN